MAGGRVLFLLCVVCLVGCQETNKIYFLALAPFPDERPGFDPSYAGGPSLLPAVRLAVERINNNTSLLGDYELDFTMEDSGCAQTSKATIAFARGFLNSEVPIAGIIGPACSGSTQAVGFLGGMNTTSVVQIATATSPALNDAQYSNTFRALSSSLIYVDVFCRLIELNQWERVGALYDAERFYFRSTHSTFVRRLTENNFTLKFSSPVSTSLVSNTAFLPDEEIVNQAKVVFVFVRSELASILLCYAWQLHLTFPSLQWIFHDRFRENFARNVSFFYRGIKYECNKDEMARASEGVILSVYALKTQDRDNITDAGLTYNEFFDQYERELMKSSTTLEPDLYANVYYDAVWSLAFSLNTSLAFLGRNFTFSRKEEVALEVRKHLLGLRFIGMSGTVWFDETTLASNSSAINISRLEYNDTLGDSQVMLSVLYDPTTTNRIDSDFPPGTFIIDELSEVVDIPLGLGIFFLIVFSVIAVVTAALHVINTIWSDYKTVKANSPSMNNLIFSGCYVVGISGILFTVQRTFLSSDHPVAYSILCNIVFTWCNTISLSLILGTICVKSWRIYRIFTVFRARQYLISDNLLLGFVLLLLVLDMILIFTWNFLDPWTIKTTLDTSGDKVEVGCTCKYLGIWVTTVLLYKGILLIMAVALAILTRRVHRREFKYSKSTNTFVYSLIVIIVAVILLNLVFDIPLLTFFLFVLNQASFVILSLVFLLLPSVLPLFKHYFYTTCMIHSSYNRSLS